MAHHVEPMDIDSDFDNKENSLHHNNVLPFTEKGYKELDVSELNMKLRYSVTPAASPMSRSYTANCFENKALESGDDCISITVNDNANLTRSLNSTMTKNDNIVRSLKGLPLKTIPTEQYIDSNRNTSVLRPLESTIPFPLDNKNLTVTVSPPSDIDEISSVPSSVSSAIQTPEATSPTTDIPSKDGGSPIMRGLKSVLSIFRSSQSPIPPAGDQNTVQSQILSPVDEQVPVHDSQSQAVLASTPIAAHRKKEMSPTKRSSPQRDTSIVFNDDLEKELLWKDETTIIFSQERIPVHKLMLPQHHECKKINKNANEVPKDDTLDLNSTVEYMDISNDSIMEKTVTGIQTDNKQADNTFAIESDSEFVDCETTFTKNDGHLAEDADKTPVGDLTHELNLTQEFNLTQEIKNNNDSGSRLKQIILDTTQDILNATLSVNPEDLLPEVLDEAKKIIPIPDSEKASEIYRSTNENSALQLDETVTQVDDHLFDATLSDTTHIKGENFDITKTDESILGTTRTDEQLTVTESQNTTILNESVSQENKPSDAQVTSILEHVDNGLDATLTEPNDPTNANELPISQTEIIKTSIIELPVDIPLPEEDDLDILPVNLPLDLVDDIKLMSGSIEQLHNIITDGSEVLTEKANEYETVVPDQLHASSLTLLEDHCNINDQASDLNSKETDENLQEFVDQNTVNFNIPELDKPTEGINILPKISSSSYTILVNECENMIIPKAEDGIISVIDNDVNRIKNVDLNNVLKAENSCEIEPLPDVINQTITMSNTDNIESTIIVPASEEEVSKPENIDMIPKDARNIEVESQVLKEIEVQVSTLNKSQTIIETSEVNQEISLPPDAVLNMSANLPNNSTSTIIHSIRINENVTDPIEFNETNLTIETDAHIEKVTLPMEGDDVLAEISKSNTTEEEIILSENNSPFTLITADIMSETKPEANIETVNVEDLAATKVKLVLTPPKSPPITSKGYNFNFDDIDFDPFATKTNIRMSPPFESPKNPPELKIFAKSVDKPIPKKDNRRQTQSERKRSSAPRKKFNPTLITKINDNLDDTCSKILNSGPVDIIKTATIVLNPNNVPIDEKISIDVPPETEYVHEEIQTESEIAIGNNNEQSISTEYNQSSTDSRLNDLKVTSSSELSAYCTASDSSIPSRNVFNLPEIDDINFNPFATKSMIRQSPPPALNVSNLFTAKSPVPPELVEKEEVISLDKIDTELMEKDAAGDFSNTTDSSKVTDERNITTKEINTEDEDTIEGPFLEVEELNLDEKISISDGESPDMMQFTNMPAQNNEENVDDGEMFIDAEAFEFLLNQNKTNTVIDSGKESLFLKFDPLFAKRMSAITSDGVVASLAKLQKNQSTPTKVAQSSPKNIPVAGPSNINITHDVGINHSEDSNDDLNITISKPMMVVPPAVNPVTPRNKSLTPNRSNRRSITFTSPAMAVIDRLLSLSGNNSILHDTTVTQVSREQNEADSALSQLRELLAEKEINVYNLRSESHELRDRLNTLETHVKNLEAESQDRLKKINQLNDTLAEKTKINRSMAAVVEEYERTIASLIAETAQDKKKHAEERIKLINERDEQTAHLASMEVSFSDLHSKYEKSKQIILNCKLNEDAYKKSIKEFEENFTKMQNNYELLKQHATSKLNHANQEMEKINRTHEAEVLKLNAMIKRKELHATSLEESLNQKIKANKELTAICDELINKVG